ncbi:MAG: MBL fold metallo-hydrolase [Candidatus Hermodarchaeota archaeon]
MKNQSSRLVCFILILSTLGLSLGLNLHPLGDSLNGLCQETSPLQMYEYNGVEIRWLGNAGFQLKKINFTIYIDPYDLHGTLEKGDVVIITHDHYDHCSPTDISKIANTETTIFTVIQNHGSVSTLTSKEVHYVVPNDILEIEGENITLEFVPMYNIIPARLTYHPKEENYVGVIIDFDGTRIYHAGDTDHIPEMKTFVTDIALLPVCGNYMMTAAEAAAAVESLKNNSDLHAAIPMHYGSVVGSINNAYDFRDLANTTVIILDEYPPSSSTQTSSSTQIHTSTSSLTSSESSLSTSGFTWLGGVIAVGIMSLILKRHFRLKFKK